MHQAFQAVFKLHERTIAHDRNDLAADLCAHGVVLADLGPGVLRQLLQAQGDLFLLSVDVEDLHLDVLLDLDALGRMADSPPTHVRDMQQPVQAAQVDEDAEIGDVLDHALANLALRQLGQK